MLRQQFPQCVSQSTLASVHDLHDFGLGLDKLAQQKREEAGSKALPGLGKRSRLDLDDAEEEVPAASVSQRDAGSKPQSRQYRSNRLDTPSHPGQLL